MPNTEVKTLDRELLDQSSEEDRTQKPNVGQWVDGYAVPVVNEKAVRVGAGVLFAAGLAGISGTFLTMSIDPMKTFGVLFMVDMLLRVSGLDRFSPSLFIGRLATRNLTPQWVGAEQKEFAWWMGFGLALTSCGAFGFLGAPLWVPLMLCTVCLTLLFLEAAFGICVGCRLQLLFSKNPPQYCPGGSCPAPRQKRRQN